MNGHSFTGLRHIVYINRIFSVTYFNVTFGKFEQKISLVKKTLLILWSIIFMAISAYNSYYKLNGMIVAIVKNWTFGSLKSDVFVITLAFGRIGYQIQSFVIQILLLLRGSKIINLIKTQNL